MQIGAPQLIIITIIVVVFISIYLSTEGFDPIEESVYDAANSQQAQVDEQTSILDGINSFVKNMWSRISAGAIEVPAMVSLDSTLTPNQVSLVEINAANLSPGTCVDLYKITGNPYLKTNAFPDGQTHDAQYCVDNDNDAVIDVCAIGRFAFSRSKSCWTFEGTLSDLRKQAPEPIDTSTKWLLRPESQQGSNDKSPLDSCPFPQQHCAGIFTTFSDNLKGYKTFSDGAKYEYDGSFVRRLI